VIHCYCSLVMDIERVVALFVTYQFSCPPPRYLSIGSFDAKSESEESSFANYDWFVEAEAIWPWCPCWSTAVLGGLGCVMVVLDHSHDTLSTTN